MSQMIQNTFASCAFYKQILVNERMNSSQIVIPKCFESQNLDVICIYVIYNMHPSKKMQGLCLCIERAYDQ